MSSIASRALKAMGLLRRHPTLPIPLSLALAFSVASRPATMKAQDAVPGATSSPSVTMPAAPAAGLSTSSPATEYLINPGDVVDVSVYDVPELSHTYTVSPSGTVTVPLLPQPIQAAGLTSEQFARALEEAFRQSGRLLRPAISVTLKQSLNSSVAVEGAVKTPQIVFEIGRVRLIDALTQCGGLTDDAGKTVTITRGSLGMRDLARDGGHATPTLTVELKKVMDVSDPASTIEVWPGDRVSVERKQPDVYYVLGEVRSPGGYTIKNGHEELTFLRALAIVG